MMASNSRSSSDSEGGAALYAAAASPAPAHDTAKTETTSDEELALVQASARFGELNDPFTEAPEVPRSVAPTTYRYGQPIPNPQTTYRPQQQGGFHQMISPEQNGPQNNTQTITRYRQSFSSDGSAGSGWAGSPGAVPQEPALLMVSTIHKQLMTASQYVNVSPGVTGSLGQKHSNMLQEISHLVNAAIQTVRRERDAAVQFKNEEHDKFKRALYDENQSREQRDKAQRDLKLAMEKEEFLRKHVEMLKNQLDMATKQVAAVERDAKRFQEHHAKVTQEYQGQDEKHYKQIQELETEIKKLRMVNADLAKGSGLAETSLGGTEFPSPSIPESAADSPEDESRMVESKLTEKDTAMLLEGLKSQANNDGQEDRRQSRSTFIPNPQAPAWTPPQAPAALPSTTALVLRDARPGTAFKVEESSSMDKGKDKESLAHSRLGSQVTSNHTHRNSDESQIVYEPRLRGNTNSSGLSFQPKMPVGGGARLNLPRQQQPTPQFTQQPFTSVAEYGSSGDESWMGKDKAINRLKEKWDEIDVKTAVEHLYEVTKGYIVNCHRQGPPNVDNKLLQQQEPNTWQYLTRLVYNNPQQASAHMRYLLSIDVYIAYILQRTCIDYLLTKIIAPGIFMGFSEEIDRHLSALQEQISVIAMSNQRSSGRSRQKVIEEHARLIRAILASPNVKKFKASVVEHHANMMAIMLEPMRSKGVSREQALKSLRIMVSATWEISTKVWTSGMTLHYSFPDCGSKYAFGTMNALNARQVARSPEQLQYSQCRVSLVVTPTLSLRDDREGEHLKTYGIHKSEVLVMK